MIELAIVVSSVTMLGFLLLGVPVAFSLGIAGVLGFWIGYGSEMMWGYLALVPYRQAAHYTLGVLPLFILMGRFAFEGKFSKALYDLGYSMFGRYVRGGLAIGTISGQAVFAACTGSSSATAAAFAPIAHPEMVRYGYDKRLSLGTLAAGGTLGILIPPSVTFIIYAMLTGNSISALFIAGVFPGIMLAALYASVVWVWAKINPKVAPLRPEGETSNEQSISFISALKGTWAILVTFIVVLGGIWGGLFTAYEAGAIGAACTLILAIIYRMKYTGFTKAIVDSMETTAMVFMLVTCAFIFGYFFSLAKVPQAFVELVKTLGLGKWGLLAIITIIYFILGCVMDQIAIQCLTIPITYPMMTAVGWDPIWYGVYVVLTTEIGLMTPPLGLNCFVLSGVTGEPLSRVFAGVWGFIGVALLAILIISLFPQIALFLPMTMKGQ
ncbi:MAG: TRAP transporter large permease [Deltaproteobacteria bacterium]|nr:TRAP transporter large permease [Deltaproteobacteria bacterium]